MSLLFLRHSDNAEFFYASVAWSFSCFFLITVHASFFFNILIYTLFLNAGFAV